MRIAINGFGRIGRIVFRIIQENQKNDSNIKIVAINNPNLSKDYALYLIKHDSTHGNINYDNDIFDDIILFNERDPQNLNWAKLEIDVVIESTGIFTTLNKAQLHINAGAKNVIISSPSIDAPMFVIGVNSNKYNGEKIISNASCTTNCIAPIAKLINDNFIIKEGLMTTIHSITASQRIVDGTNKNWRLGRSCMNNIIPTSTGAAKAVEMIIQELKGKLTGMSLRVPTIDVSVVDLTIKTEKKISFNKIIDCIDNLNIKGIIGYTNEELVSSDFIGNSYSSIIDISASIQLNDTFIKLIIWYDNEYGYSSRLVDLIDLL